MPQRFKFRDNHSKQIMFENEFFKKWSNKSGNLSVIDDYFYDNDKIDFTDTNLLNSVINNPKEFFNEVLSQITYSISSLIYIVKDNVLYYADSTNNSELHYDINNEVIISSSGIFKNIDNESINNVKEIINKALEKTWNIKYDLNISCFN